jgi:hypothetical protein
VIAPTTQVPDYVLADREYLRTLGMGTPCTCHPDEGLMVRPIPGTGLFDGLLAWPYVQVSPLALADLVRRHPTLVTLVGVLSPAAEIQEVLALRNDGFAVRELKDHFVLDPGLPMRSWSASTRTKIRRSQATWEAAQLDESDAADVFSIYVQVVASRGLAGTFFDFTADHFGFLLGSSSAQVVGARDVDGRLGAFLALVEDGRDLHALHLGGTPHAYQTWALYGLMAQVVDQCRDEGRRLFLGGIPSGGRPSARTFKERWTNTHRASHLVEVVVNHEAYESLPAVGPPGYFPRYRRPWA